MTLPAMTRRVRCASALLRRNKAVLLTAAAGAALSVLVFSMMRDGERRERQAQFEATAHQRVEVLRESLNSSLGVLHALAGLHDSGLPVDRASFRKFVLPALSHRPELQALSWATRIPASEREQVENAVRAEGFPDFQFLHRDPRTGATFRAPDQPEDYFVVLLIEPLQRNTSAFGREVMHQSSTAARARDSGRGVSSSIVTLFQDEQNQPGMFVHVPLFRGPVPETVEGRRAQSTGFVTAVFRMSDLVGPALSRLPGMRATIADRDPLPHSLSFTPPPLDDTAASTSLHPCSFELQAADRTLIVTFTATQAFRNDRQQWESWATLACGLLITLLSSGYLATWLRRNAEIAQTNAALQAEVIERKHAEEAAAAANRAKTGFVTDLSHEIRTPLNSILGYAQILERGHDLAPRDREAVNAIAASGHHLLGLLNSVLDLSRIEAGKAELRRTAFDLPALVRNLVPMFRSRAAEKGIELRVVCEVSQSRGAVLGDDGRIRQVLINLIGNAIKFTQRGQVLVQIHPSAGETWHFEVIDSGIGLTEHERRSLFHPFYQTANGSRLGGSGLGLAIAQGHVQLMGGRLAVDSQYGVGTRFHFTIPLPAAVVTAADGPLKTLPRLARGQRVHALVVDDSRDNRHILARLLADIGCAVAEAATALDARDLARQAPPDVVFLDLFLAETTGTALLAELRRDGLAPETPVLLHTAALLTREQHEELRATGADLLQKPFRVEDLCACLKRIPGLAFEDVHRERPQPPADPQPPDFAGLDLPRELRERIVAAAELHNTTVLKECLPELRQRGGASARMAEHLRHLLRTYDLAAIADLVRGIDTAGTTGAPETSVATNA